jgi:hypothetical protein
MRATNKTKDAAIVDEETKPEEISESFKTPVQ